MTKSILFWLLATVLLITAQPAEAQQPKKTARIGYLSPRFAPGPSAPSPNVNGFRQGLRELGYLEGQNIMIEWRFAEAKLDRLPVLAAELIGLKIDLIVAQGTSATQAAKQKTTTLPVVALVGGNPVDAGLVASLARPGGNVTGLTNFTQELGGKRLELLKEIVPKLSHVGILLTPNAPGAKGELRNMKVVAQGLGLKVQAFEVLDVNQLEKTFSTMTQGRVGALIVLPDPAFGGQRKRIVELAIRSRLPTMYGGGESIQEGGLLSYAASTSEISRRAAIYVDRILKGTKPSDLPVEQPTKFELVINLKTAKQIGLTIPPNVLARADKVIR